MRTFVGTLPDLKRDRYIQRSSSCDAGNTCGTGHTYILKTDRVGKYFCIQRITPISLMKTSNDRSEIINKSLCSARTCDSAVSGYRCLEHSEYGLLLLVRIWADSVCCGAPMFGSFWVNGIFFVLAGYRLGFKIAQECILYYTAMLIQQHG